MRVIDTRHKTIIAIETAILHIGTFLLGVLFALCWLFDDAEIAEVTRRFW